MKSALSVLAILGMLCALASAQDFRLSPLAGTRRLLVSSNDRAINVMHRPVHLTSGIGLLLDRLKETLPDAGSAPAIEATGHGAPGAMAFGQITPGRTGA